MFLDLAYSIENIVSFSSKSLASFILFKSILTGFELFEYTAICIAVSFLSFISSNSLSNSSNVLETKSFTSSSLSFSSEADSNNKFAFSVIILVKTESSFIKLVNSETKLYVSSPVNVK